MHETMVSTPVTSVEALGDTIVIDASRRAQPTQLTQPTQAEGEMT
ncbi:MAG: hypothetical protein ACYCST_05680 [Acidimicrobiales bacterium]